MPKKQRDLPEMEDREIGPIEDAAEEYADIRDERMRLNKKEFELKDRLHNLMKKHDMKKYHREKITVELVSEEETVKVRIAKEKKKPKGKD